jgi:type I restriction enzyme S subunit
MTIWHETTLGQLLKIEHGFAFKSKYFSEAGEFVVLTPGNFHESGGFRARPGKDRFYQGKFPSKYLLDKNDLIVAMTEQGEGLLGSAALVPDANRYLHNQRLGRVTVKTGSDKRFVYYLFNTDLVRRQIRNSSSGAKVRHTSPERIYQIKVFVPEETCQQKIAAILYSYDELIEINKRRIALLEKLAEEIYREWFVRFRFPGHESRKATSEFLKGCQLRDLDSLADEVKVAIKKKDLTGEEKYLGLEHIPRRSIAIKEWATADTIESNKLLFQERDILFSKIRPYLHKVAISHFSGICSSDTIILRPKKKIYEGYLLFTVFSDTFIDLSTAASRGTKMPRADWGFLKKLQIRVPDEKLLQPYQTQFDELFSQIVNLLRVNELAATCREQLLPRLISGKLAVDNLDIQFPPSMAKELEEQQSVAVYA